MSTKLHETLGINPIKGGCAALVSGQIVRNEPYSIIDKETKEERSGHSCHVAYFGGVMKIRTEDGDPLRLIPIGTDVDLVVSLTTGSGGLRQVGPAQHLNAAK
ncbi:MAG: hypothetical protein ACF8MF_06060 [Phycisphaerales bacterium JB052]